MNASALAAALVLVAAPLAAQAQTLALAADPAPARPVSALATEPLFADIIGRSQRLLGFANAYREVLAEDADAPLPEFAVFRNELKKLSELDAQAVDVLETRSLDSDLKCILRGISADISVKLSLLDEARDGKAKDKALKELAYLLNDNVEVITAPPSPPV